MRLRFSSKNLLRTAIITMVSFLLITASVQALVIGAPFGYDYGVTNMINEPKFVTKNDLSVNGQLDVLNNNRVSKAIMQMASGRGAVIELKNDSDYGFQIGNYSGNFTIANNSGDPVVMAPQNSRVEFFGDVVVNEGGRAFRFTEDSSGARFIYESVFENAIYLFENLGNAGFWWGNSSLSNIGKVTLNNSGQLVLNSIAGNGSGLTSALWTNISEKPGGVSDNQDSNSVAHYTTDTDDLFRINIDAGTTQNNITEQLEFSINMAPIGTSSTANNGGRSSASSRYQLVAKDHTHNWNTLSNSVPVPTWRYAEDPNWRFYCKTTQRSNIYQTWREEFFQPSVPSGYSCGSWVETGTYQGSDNLTYSIFNRTCTYSSGSGPAWSPPSGAVCNSLVNDVEGSGFQGARCSNNKTAVDYCASVGGTGAFYTTDSDWIKVVDDNTITGGACESNEVMCGMKGRDLNDAGFSSVGEPNLWILCCQLRFIVEE